MWNLISMGNNNELYLFFSPLFTAMSNVKFSQWIIGEEEFQQVFIPNIQLWRITEKRETNNALTLVRTFQILQKLKII
jgi:hypothetical protein